MRGVWGIVLAVCLLLWVRSAASASTRADDLPKKSVTLAGFSLDKVKKRMSEMPLRHIEGVWQFRSEGVTVVIEHAGSVTADGKRDDRDCYLMVLAESPNRAMRPGTVMGYVIPSAGRGRYEASMYTMAVGSTLMMPKRFDMKLEDGDDELVFTQRRGALSVNLWRMLPYLWRHVVTRNHEPHRSRGCVRVFPEPELPLEPVYL